MFSNLAILLLMIKYLSSFELNSTNSTNSNSSSSSTALRLEDTNNQLIYFIKLDLTVNEFLSYEPKSGLIEFDLNIKYKWWDNQSRITQEEYNAKKSQLTKSLNLDYFNSFYPAIRFMDKNTKLMIKNQLHRVDNLEEFYETDTSPKKRMFLKRENAKYFRQYSQLEQNFIIRFLCKTFEPSYNTNRFYSFFHLYSPDHAMETFPFDTHECDLKFSIIPKQLNQMLKISKQKQTPVYLFPIKEESSSLIDYNKLVEASNNYSWVKREWLLKKVNLFYTNQTVDASVKPDLSSKSNVLVKFHIFRRREPQMFVFVIPLGVFTIVTFLVFFLPAHHTSEKVLVAFFNLLCLLVFNIYLFKLLIFIYELVKIPLILQYSNCLMLIQLGVFVYTCLIKSMYFTINNGLLSSAAQQTYKQILSINSSKTINSLLEFCNSSSHSSVGMNYHRFDVSRNSPDQDTIKLKMPVIKLTHDEFPFGVESNAGTTRHFSCDCNSMETETDCCVNDSRAGLHLVPEKKPPIDDKLFSIPADGKWVMRNFKRKLNEYNPRKKEEEQKQHQQHQHQQQQQQMQTKEKQLYFIGDRYSSYDLIDNKAKPNFNNNSLKQLTDTLEISKLNLNVKKLVKMEELNLREKLIRNEWTKKARFCDMICFLLAFFLLLICSLLIFIVFPSEYFKVPSFLPRNDD